MTTNVNIEISEFNSKLAKKINAILLFIHSILLISFAIIGIPIMVIMNILSVTIYIIMFKMITKNIIIYLEVTYAEVLLHMFLASFCMGWSCGFQLYCFAVIPIVYFCDYLSKKNKITTVYPIPMIASVIISYFILRIFCPQYSTLIDISGTVATIVFTINASIVFMFLIIYHYLYQNMGLATERLLQHMVECDMLTGLSNRYAMNTLFDELIPEEYETEQNFSIAILDIDNFKLVNDTYGHNVGDEVLKMVAEILKESEGSNIHASRWGGEEFLIVISGKNSYETAKALLELIRVKVESSSLETKNKKISITISCGISIHHFEEPIISTISRADSFLYKAKNNGKNQVVAEDKKI